LREACRQISEWRADSIAHRHLTVSVNLSAKQFLQPNLVEDIRKLLLELALPPEALKLEITESTVMADASAAVEMLRQIKSLGIRLAIDDFGTGYSSLSYLHRFPLDSLKIDRSFISSMCEGGEGMEIARTILPMANNLRLDVVAEGVETVHQVVLLQRLQCKYGQGYYFSRPLSTEGTAALLAGDLTWQACEQPV
jgi:EAL domain-containing protein (putative c-di-GMP-specific phosphodiesterase class I)